MLGVVQCLIMGVDQIRLGMSPAVRATFKAMNSFLEAKDMKGAKGSSGHGTGVPTDAGRPVGGQKADHGRDFIKKGEASASKLRPLGHSGGSGSGDNTMGLPPADK